MGNASGRNLGIVKVDLWSLARLIGLPDDATIIDVEKSFVMNHDAIYLKVESCAMPLVPSGGCIPYVKQGSDGGWGT